MEKNNVAVVDLLKTDTQGFDLEVLLGATKALRSGKIRNVLVDLIFIRIHEGQGSAIEILKLLEEHDFFLVDFYEKFRLDNTIEWCTALFSRRHEQRVFTGALE